jgi:diaminohydroxyphosphoribosylaminopyrimidine deaminase / 5-amino-6-(5-phosphoribosylamino)uracil reductase
MMQSEQIKYMARCLELAKMGEGHTAPNPMVGCVIVHDKKIIGEGFHQRCGKAHAEVNAINSVKDPDLLKYSTLFVNLEPCSHYGKTAPCADLIIEKGIPEIVIGTVDPNPLVSGQGIQKLLNKGCHVETGFLESECKELNRRFFTCHEKQRPYIILKWAQTNDGFVDTNRSKGEIGRPNWITDEIARIAVHKQRSTEGAILVGTTTALRDNPSLTLRDWYGKQPLRMVFDNHHRLPSDLKLFNGEVQSITLTGDKYPDSRNTEYIYTSEDDQMESIMKSLYKMKVQSVIVEGGPFTLQRFIDSGLWDEAHIYTSILDFIEGIKAPQFSGEAIYEESFSNSRLSVYRNL